MGDAFLRKNKIEVLCIYTLLPHILMQLNADAIWRKERKYYQNRDLNTSKYHVDKCQPVENYYVGVTVGRFYVAHSKESDILCTQLSFKVKLK